MQIALIIEHKYCNLRHLNILIELKNSSSNLGKVQCFQVRVALKSFLNVYINIIETNKLH